MKLIFSLASVAALFCASCKPAVFFMREAPSLEHRTEADLIREFGPPRATHSYTVANFFREPEPYRSRSPGAEVLSLYPTNVAGNLEVEIQSLSWQSGRILHTAWLRQKDGHWISFYASDWNMDVVE